MSFFGRFWSMLSVFFRLMTHAINDNDDRYRGMTAVSVNDK
jgi:hypothetical protein